MSPTKRRIESLTPEQEALLPVFREEWLARGLATGPCDRPAIEGAVAQVYRARGFEPPPLVIWMSSPLGGAFASAVLGGQLGDQLRAQLWGQLGDQLGGQLGDQLRDQLRAQLWGQLWGQLGDQLRGQLRDQLWGQLWGAHDAYWAAWLIFGKLIGAKLDHPDWLDGMAAMCDTGWWWPMRGAVVLTERPTELHRDAQGRLHNTSGIAIGYSDGWGLWAIHGVRVDERIIMRPETLTPKDILALPNAEVRRVAAERYGWERFLPDCNAKLVDRCPDPANSPHELVLYSVPESVLGFRGRLLLCTNATPERDGTIRRFGLTVPADMPDALTAAAWTFGLDAQDYRALERAS